MSKESCVIRQQRVYTMSKQTYILCQKRPIYYVKRDLCNTSTASVQYVKRDLCTVSNSRALRAHGRGTTQKTVYDMSKETYGICQKRPVEHVDIILCIMSKQTSTVPRHLHFACFASTWQRQDKYVKRDLYTVSKETYILCQKRPIYCVKRDLYTGLF